MGYTEEQEDILFSKKTDWISIEDRLPDRYQNVLGWNRAKNEFYTGKYITLNQTSIGIKTDVVYYNEQTDKFVNNVMYVTHWMPLPKPPKQ